MTAAIESLHTRLKVGMEVHVELATRSKMWTSAPNVAHPDYFDASPNSLLDPVVIGMPGVLPVMNRRALEMAMLVGLALNCRIARFSKWDRKSYYYPDLPKNYQISQYDLPICYDGAIDISLSADDDGPTKRIGIIRAHLEEDAGKLLHEAPGGAPIDHSIIDLNRAGTPLLEIVTEPDFESADECVIFANVLRDLCRHLGVTEGVMQQGHIRFEPNINVIITRDGDERVYTTPIVEIKNLNSFKALHEAVMYEHHRQIEQWLKTGRVMGRGEKSTRGWDDQKQITFLQREKEDAHDYRYFPDPDLVPVVVDDHWLAQIEMQLIETPLARRRRYVHDLGLDRKIAQQILDEPNLTCFFESLLAVDLDARKAAAMLVNYGQKHANERGRRIDQLGVTPEQIKQIHDLTVSDQISSSAADQLFGLCCDQPDAAPKQLAEQHKLLQVSDATALDTMIDQILADAKNHKTIEDIQNGKDAAVGALVGQLMKLSKGQANPKLAGEMIKKRCRS